MQAEVTWDNKEALKDYDSRKEKEILQKLIAEALDGLKTAKAEIRDAIVEFDAAYGKNPPASQKEADERLKTFETVCGQIAKAQQDKVRKAVEREWETHKKRDAALTRMNLKFSAEIILATISLTAAAVTAILSMGTLAVTLVGAGKTLVTTALKIKEFAGDRDDAAKDVIGVDATLSKAYNGPEVKGQAFKTAKEIAAAAGMPFIDTVGKMEDKLENFLGKSARVDKDLQSLYETANEMMAALKKVDAGDVGADNAKKAKEMGGKVSSMLDTIGELRSSVDSDNVFYKVNNDRCRQYKAMNGKAVGNAAKFTAIAVLAAGLASEAKTIVDIALKLA
jgi:hypothetical protein